jgi:hypothetical protein
MDIFGNPNIAKNRKKYNCEKCDYITCNKTDYIKHSHTKKHTGNNFPSISIEKSQKIATKYECVCGKKYTDNSGLWKHKKKCTYNNNIDILNNDNLIVEKLTSLIMDVIKQNQDTVKDVVKQNQEAIKQTNELALKITDVYKHQTNNTITNCNNNNKTFNLNVFLNETCKDAMNMSEFINSLQIEYDDFEKVGEIGFVNGISNIIIKNLKELDVTQRPLHCTDKKREVVYVKEDNIWQKEDENYTKTRKLIKKTADKNTRLLPEFKRRYPDCGKSTSKYSDKYDLLIIETMGGSGDNDFEKETKILKNIAREVFINKVL